jgi:beta-phosphoglucomutase
MPAKAFIFDLNGTMIDDMTYHAKAWYDILTNDLKANLTREQVKQEMYGKNEELLVRVFGENYFSEEQMKAISEEKEKRYQEAYAPNLRLIEGLPEFLATSHKKNIKMAIGSAAIPFNIDFVINNLNIRHYFKAIVSAESVARSKPDPETFLKAASLLGIGASHCLVFEDAPKGVEAAQRAGMNCIVLTTTHKKGEFSNYDNVMGYFKDYKDPELQEFIAS